MSWEEKTIDPKTLHCLKFLSDTISFSGAITQRKNTYGGAAHKKNSGVVGVSKRHHSSNCTISVFTRKMIAKNPAGAFLIYFMNTCIQKMFPTFHFTAVMMNKNFEGQLHVDRLNIGRSVMITFGDFVGGELMIHDYRESEANVIEVKDKAIIFDGNMAHATMPYSGVRYTYVFFDTMDYYRAQMSHVSQDRLLHRLMFCPQEVESALLSIDRKRGAYPSAKDRIEAAREHERRLRLQYQSRLLRLVPRQECRQLAPSATQPAEAELREKDTTKMRGCGDDGIPA